MDTIKDSDRSRKNIAIRFIYALVFLVMFEILKIILQFTVLFQYVYLLITKKHSEPVREFSNKLATYIYKIIRYVTLSDNDRPFPFNSLPDALEGLESDIRFP
jgi:hypothetical protein